MGFRNKEFIKLVQRIVLDEHSAKDIAKSIGKSYSTLLREINPYDLNAKLGVETLMQICRVTNNYAPLEYMAKSVGYEVKKDERQVS